MLRGVSAVVFQDLVSICTKSPRTVAVLTPSVTVQNREVIQTCTIPNVQRNSREHNMPQSVNGKVSYYCGDWLSFGVGLHCCVVSCADADDDAADTNGFCRGRWRTRIDFSISF